MSASLTASGIAMPATASAVGDANTLDDYEEGTWTPTVAAGISSPSYTTQLGIYNKIGRTVYLSFQLRLGGGGSTSIVDFQIAGCPFTSNSNTGYYNVGALLCIAGTALVQTAQVLVVVPNEAKIHIWRQNTGGYNGVTGVQIGVSGRTIGTVNYTI